MPRCVWSIPPKLPDSGGQKIEPGDLLLALRDAGVEFVVIGGVDL
jgi:hypothetical protein